MLIRETDHRDFFIGVTLGIPLGIALWAVLIRGLVLAVN